MALVVEDGTGKPDAESYADVTFCDTYHSNRGRTAWAALTTAQKEAALRLASDYMIETYRMRWKGSRVLLTQALDWPRVGVVREDTGQSQGRNGLGSYGLFQVDYTTVPIEVKKACAELALRSLTTTLNADQSRAVLSETVGPISVEYDPDSPQKEVYLAVDLLLCVYFKTSDAMVKLTRV